MQDEVQVGNVFFYVYCDGGRNVAQARGGNDLLSFLDLIEGITSFIVSYRPEIVFSNGQDGACYRLS